MHDDTRIDVGMFAHEPPDEVECGVFLSLHAENDLVARVVLDKEGTEVRLKPVVDARDRFENGHRLEQRTGIYGQ